MPQLGPPENGKANQGSVGWVSEAMTTPFAVIAASSRRLTRLNRRLRPACPGIGSQLL